jgi:hypothetical protein
MPHTCLLFLDGVGLGPPGGANPLTDTPPALVRLAGGQAWTADLAPVARAGHAARGIDATLGVEGLPQSGTGQAALFTGVNASRLVGRHFGPFPHSATREALARRNVFARVHALPAVAADGAAALAADGAPPRTAFANAYPPRFFAFAKRRDRWPVTTRCCLDAGVRLRTTEDLAAGRAVAADLTGAGWPEAEAPPPVSPAEAGRRLHALTRRHALTVFEYYLTDKLGHGRLDTPPAALLADLDRFVAGFLEAFDPARDLVVVTSDHGNLEDLSIKTHTRHPVPLLALGAGAARFADVADLTGVTPALVAAVRG